LPGFLFPIRKSSLRNNQIAFAAVVVAELLSVAFLFSRAGEDRMAGKEQLEEY
jgi:hypothetical protein